MFNVPDEAARARAARFTRWLPVAWRLSGACFALTLGCTAGLLAKDQGLLGGYRGAGTEFFEGVLFLSGPALFLLSLVLVALGLVGGRGLSALGGLGLLTFSVLATGLAIGLVGAAH